MNPELQTVVERLELVERQNRGLRTASLLAVLVALVAIAMTLFGVSSRTPDRARFSLVEANRFLLRGPDGRVAGGMEVDGQGQQRIVLGPAHGQAAAFLEIRRDGVPHLTLRGADGGVRALLAGTDTPSLALAAPGARTGVLVATEPGGDGSIVVSDHTGRPRFRAP